MFSLSSSVLFPEAACRALCFPLAKQAAKTKCSAALPLRVFFDAASGLWAAGGEKGRPFSGFKKRFPAKFTAYKKRPVGGFPPQGAFPFQKTYSVPAASA